MNLSIFRIILSLASCALLSGCADLTIKVYTYTGDESVGGDAQLAQAVGEAYQANQQAREFARRLDSHKYSGEWRHSQQTIEALVTDYETIENIDKLKTDMDKAAQQSNAAGYAAARRQLALALVRYSQLCISCGQTLGIPAENEDWIWTLHETGRQPVIASVALEQAGIKIQRLASNVVDNEQYTGMVSMFKSLQNGILANRISPAAPSYENSLNNNNWTQINVQHFNGSGKLNDVIVKDEVGNWVQKSFSNDPSGVIQAVFDGASLMVDTLAAAYGVPVPKTTGNSAGAATPANSAETSPDLTAQSNQAKHALTLLHRSQNALRGSLQEIIANGTDPQSEQKAIAQAVLAYQSQVKAIEQSNSVAPAPTTPVPITQSPTNPAPVKPATPPVSASN